MNRDGMKQGSEVWIDWRRMNPMVDPSSLDEIDRRMIAAQQEPASANRPITEA